MSISKNQIKLITSLQQKKYRQKHQLFVAEGVKVVEELLNSSFEVFQIFCVETYNTATFLNLDTQHITIISEKELQKISTLKTPNKVLGLFRIPEKELIETSNLILALDAINDPGNLGTIIRLCDWFGITQLICSHNTVDCYNSKTVQASMGSLTRVQIHYVDLVSYIKETPKKCFIADMNGENVYQYVLPKEGVLIMGNEANGVSDKIKNTVHTKISIPAFGTSKTESLNVATATAILLSEFRRGV